MPNKGNPDWMKFRSAGQSGYAPRAPGGFDRPQGPQAKPTPSFAMPNIKRPSMPNVGGAIQSSIPSEQMGAFRKLGKGFSDVFAAVKRAGRMFGR